MANSNGDYKLLGESTGLRRYQFVGTEQAAEVGDLAFVKRLANRHIKRSDYPLGEFVFAARYAALGGHVEILQWLLGYMEGNYDGGFDMASITFVTGKSIPFSGCMND